MTVRHIVAMGGGGFSMEPENPLLDDFILGLTGKRRPKVCFLATASGDADGYIERFYKAMPQRRCQASHLGLFKRTNANPSPFLLEQDVIFVGGGNTANMLAIWRVHGFDEIAREAWERGIVLSGWSAGMICWFEAGVTDSFGPQLEGLRDGLGFLPGSACPHYDSEELRRPVYTKLVAEGFPPGLALDEGTAAHYVGTELREILASSPDSRGYHVGPDGEVPLP